MNYGANTTVYLATGATDMRKSIDGLALIISETYKLDPFSKALFVFCNKNKTRLKALEWETSGFWLHYKRLEEGRFPWPEGTGTKTITERELRWLLDGLDIERTKGYQEVKKHALI